MNKIKFNNIELEVESYNKNTYLSEDAIVSNAGCQVILTDMTLVKTLMQENINSIQIYHDDTLIYNLTNIHARVESVSEYLNVERMNINISLTFSNDE